MRRATLLLAALLSACESEDPALTQRDTGGVTTTDTTAVDVVSDGANEAGSSCSGAELITPLADDPACKPRATDYRPGAPDDGWPVCISDDDRYHRFGASISTITRVAAFDEIAGKLGFGTDKLPTPDDFLAARTIFAADQGLGSRVERREDEHYPPGPRACNTMTADELAMYRDRCAGPAKILPIVNAAFEAGAKGIEPRANADRLEAALLWFLYLSPFKEARTCATTVADCDSSFAYYTGGDERSDGRGFARYVKARSRQTHDAIFDGILAVRCWRDLDNPTAAAADLAMRDRAVDQLDRAMNKGLAVIVRQRALRRACGSSWLGTRILGAVLDREATARDATRAAVLRAELAKTDPTTVDEKVLLTALDALFPCAW